MSLQHLAQRVRSQGRNGDTELVHMTRGEVNGLHGLAHAMGSRGGLPVNPATGLHEANFLKSILPTLVGAAVGGFTGSNALGAAAGAAVGGYQGRKGGTENTLAGLISGGMGGYGGSQLAQGFGAAANQGLGMTTALKAAEDQAGGPLPLAQQEQVVQSALANKSWADKAQAGIQALLTPEGREAAGKAVGNNPLQAIGRAAMPLGMVDTTAQGGASPIPGSNYTSPYAGGTGKWVTKSDNNGNTYRVFEYGKGPGSAAGGAVGFAGGGTSDMDTDTYNASANQGSNVTSDAVLAYLMGQGEDPQVRARRMKLVTTPGPTGREDADPNSSGGAAGLIDGDMIPGMDYANFNPEGSDGGDAEPIGGGTPMDNLGPIDTMAMYPFADASNPSGSGLNSAGEYLSDFGGDMAQFEYEHPILSKAGEYLANSLAGMPLGTLASYLARTAMNVDPTNVHGKNAVNGMDKESDDAARAAAEAAAAGMGPQQDLGTDFNFNSGLNSGADASGGYDMGTDYSGWGGLGDGSGGGDYSLGGSDLGGSLGGESSGSLGGGDLGNGGGGFELGGGDWGDFGGSFGGDWGGSFGGGDSGGGGGGDMGGSAGCVQADSILSNGQIAGDVKVGDRLELANEVTLEPDSGVVSHSVRMPQPGWRLTANGVSLVCSESAPIPTRNGIKHPWNIEGEEVAVLKDGKADWHPVHAVEIGPIEVQRITVEDKCFWAGETADGFILHHNVMVYKGARGGPVPLQSGGFVFPADVVSALGAGSSSAGLEALAKRYGAQPVRGKGHGQSDDVPAAIDGKQPARVARDEAVLSAEQVARIGGGDPKKGAKKLYDVMKRVRKQATGSPKQMRVIDPNKELA